MTGPVTFEVGPYLSAGEYIPTGGSLVSERKQYSLVNQADGNVCIYKDGKATWATGTYKKGLGNLQLLNDGNLVFYDTKSTGSALWASMSQGIGKADGPYTLVMQEDGNLVIYGTQGISTWASQSSKTGGLFESFAGKSEMPSVVTWLRTYDTLVSKNGQFTLVNQGDGNLVIHHYNRNNVSWSSSTNDKGAGNLYMQKDGNLVLYDTMGTGAPIWTTNTQSTGEAPYKLILQDDGKLVIQDKHSRTTWSSGDGSPDGSDRLGPDAKIPSGGTLLSKSKKFEFVNQRDGNLCIYTNGKATWASGTWEKGLGDLRLLRDGNLVFFDSECTGAPVWATMSQGSPKDGGPYHLYMQNDGNLVIYGAKGTPTWASQSSKGNHFEPAAGTSQMRSVASWLRTYETLVSKNEDYKLTNQGDGDLVIRHRGGTIKWHSNSKDKGVGNFYLQSDGKLALYDTKTSGKLIWASSLFVSGTAPFTATLQNNGALEVHDVHGALIWSSLGRPVNDN